MRNCAINQSSVPTFVSTRNERSAQFVSVYLVRPSGKFLRLSLQLSDSDTPQDLPPLPDGKDPAGLPQDTGPIMPVPRGIRPTLAKYRCAMSYL